MEDKIGYKIQRLAKEMNELFEQYREAQRQKQEVKRQLCEFVDYGQVFYLQLHYDCNTEAQTDDGKKDLLKTINALQKRYGEKTYGMISHAMISYAKYPRKQDLFEYLNEKLKGDHPILP